jgi:hypothetical protein
LFALSLWRIIALTFAPATRVDDDKADLTAKRASYDRVPGFMIGGFLLHCLAPQVTRIASMKLAKSTSVGTATEMDLKAPFAALTPRERPLCTTKE